MQKIIGLIHTRFSPTGGVENYINNLVLALLERNWQIHYLTARVDCPVPDGMTVHRIPVIPGASTARMLSFAYGARRIARKAELPLLMGFGRTIYQDIYRDGSGCFLDYEKHVTKRFNPLYRKSYLHLEHMRFADALLGKVISISKMVKDQIIRRYNLPPEKIEVVYNGVNPDKLNLNPGLKGDKIQIKQKLGLPSNALTLLFIGNDFARKGLAYLIRMFGSLPATLPVVLLVAGKDKREKRYRQLAQRLGCAHRIQFLGYQKNVSRLYAVADLFVLPSVFDAFGNVVLESLYCGTPVITGPSVGASELIENGNNGFVVPDYTPETLAQTILKFYSSDNRDKMSAKACQIAVGYCWDTHMKRMEAILLDVMEQKWINR